jgi:hypothetical protein
LKENLEDRNKDKNQSIAIAGTGSESLKPDTRKSNPFENNWQTCDFRKALSIEGYELKNAN